MLVLSHFGIALIVMAGVLLPIFFVALCFCLRRPGRNRGGWEEVGMVEPVETREGVVMVAAGVGVVGTDGARGLGFSDLR